jgi:protein SMG6
LKWFRGRLAETHHSFLTLALDPRMPVTLHSLPQRYNIPTRLWQTAFHMPLERLRHALLAASNTTAPGKNQPDILGHLTDFIYYAYSFYTALLDDPTLSIFKSAWIEQLGDLARYRMAVAGLASRLSPQPQPNTTTLPAQFQRGRIGDDAEERSPSSRAGGSVGEAALGDWEFEEQATWRLVARDWYAKGLTDTPGQGRLHHHLALLSRAEAHELQALFHYIRALTAAHPFHPARENILGLFDQEDQRRRTRPDVGPIELFVHLHGMLFTRIALDDFDDVLERFMEKIEGEGPDSDGDEARWIMMAAINVAAVLQYGVQDSPLRRTISREPDQQQPRPARSKDSRGGGPGSGGIMPHALMVNREHDEHDSLAGDEEEDEEADARRTRTIALAPSSVTAKRDGGSLQATDGGQDEDAMPHVAVLAQRLAARMFALAVHRRFNATRRGGRGLNPYLTFFLSFYTAIAHHDKAFVLLEREMPWDALKDLMASIPRNLPLANWISHSDGPQRLAGPPLPEDWCARGADWAGRQLFGRGFWKHRHKRVGGAAPAVMIESELDALAVPAEGLDDVVVGDDYEEIGDDDERNGGDGPVDRVGQARWRRVTVALQAIVAGVPGLKVDWEQRELKVGSPLQEKLKKWREDEEREKEEGARVARVKEEEEEVVDVESEEIESESDDEQDTEEIRALKVLWPDFVSGEVTQLTRCAFRPADESSRRSSEKPSCASVGP